MTPQEKDHTRLVTKAEQAIFAIAADKTVDPEIIKDSLEYLIEKIQDILTPPNMAHENMDARWDDPHDDDDCD